MGRHDDDLELKISRTRQMMRFLGKSPDEIASTVARMRAEAVAPRVEKAVEPKTKPPVAPRTNTQPTPRTKKPVTEARPKRARGGDGYSFLDAAKLQAEAFRSSFSAPETPAGGVGAEGDSGARKGAAEARHNRAVEKADAIADKTTLTKSRTPTAKPKSTPKKSATKKVTPKTPRPTKAKSPPLYKEGTPFRKGMVLNPRQMVHDNRVIYRRWRAGETFDPSIPKEFAPSAYVRYDDKIGYSSTKRAKVSRKQFFRTPEELAKIEKQKVERRRVRERARQKARTASKRAARKTEARVVGRELRAQLRSNPKYRKVPLSFVHGSRFTKSEKKAVSEFSRAVQYPPMQHGKRSVRKPPVPMGILNGPIGLDSPRGYVEDRAFRSGRARGQFATTTTTLSTYEYPQGGGGAGVYFRLSANTTINNLARHYPKQMLRASRRFAPMIGKKLLNIIEPFVPKDTGLLYTTATDVSGRELTGELNLSSLGAIGAGSFGVAISYNAPYAEEVYYDLKAAHGRRYNEKYGVNEKGEKETARWIEVAFNDPEAKGQIHELMSEFASKVVGALKPIMVKARGR